MNSWKYLLFFILISNLFLYSLYKDYPAYSTISIWLDIGKNQQKLTTPLEYNATYNTTNPPIDLSTSFESTIWIIKESYSVSECLHVSRRLPSCSIMCVSQNYFHYDNLPNLMVVNNTLIDYFNFAYNFSELSTQDTYFAIAIKLGAKIIYTLQDNKLSDYMAHRLETIMERGSVLYNGNATYFNSSLYFGCLSLAASDEFDDEYRRLLLCENSSIPGLSTPAILQPIQEPSHCDSTMPDIALPAQTFIPISFSSSIFSQCAFYFLPLAELSFSNHSQHQRYSCVVQHLLWQAGCHVSVYWGGYNANLKYTDISSVYKICSDMVKPLTSCNNSKDSSDCIIDAIKTSFNDTISSKLEQWIQFLKNITFLHVGQNIKSLEKCSKIIWYPKQYSRNTSKSNFQNLEAINNHYHKICLKSNRNNYTKVDIDKSWFQKPNILMLVIFNRLYTDMIPYIELMYRPFYPNIIYCADYLPKFRDIKPFKINIMSYHQHYQPGSLNYYCYLKVIKMGLKIDGILSLADDVFIKTDVVRYPMDKIWFPPEEGYRMRDVHLDKDCKNFICNITNPWLWWDRFKNQINLFLIEFDRQSDVDLKLMRKQLKDVTKGNNRVFGGMSDSVYIPKMYFRNFTKIVSLLLKNNVFLEIAIPTALRSMENIDNMHPMKILYMWTPRRMKPWTFMKNSEIKNFASIHPVKLRAVKNGMPEAIKMFCGCMLPTLHDPNQKHCD